MLIARVEGSVICTVRHASLQGWRLLICQVLNDAGENMDYPLLALDNLGAGKHQKVVLTCDGKSVREKVGDQYSPARYMTMAIVDEVTDAETAQAQTPRVASDRPAAPTRTAVKRGGK